MTSRKKGVASCSKCRSNLQEIIEASGSTDDLYLMSLSLLHGVVKVGRSKSPTQRALQLQESGPFWIFPEVIWINRGQHEKLVHDALRAYRIEDAPSREYFRLPIKTASDLVEQVLYDPTIKKAQEPIPDDDVKDDKINFSKKKENCDVCGV